MITGREEDKSFADLPASGAMVLHGPYCEVAKLLNELESRLPENVRLVYRRYSPGRLKIIAEGEL